MYNQNGFRGRSKQAVQYLTKPDIIPGVRKEGREVTSNKLIHNLAAFLKGGGSADRRKTPKLTQG